MSSAQPAPSVTAAWAVDLPSATADAYRVETFFAFLTGLEINVPASIATTDAELASTALVAQSDVPFVAPEYRHSGPQRFYRIDEETHGSAVLPASVVEVDPSWIWREIEGDTVARRGWHLEQVTAEIRDFGVGVAQLVWAPDASDPATGADLDALLAELDVETSTVMSDVIHKVTSAFRSVLEDHPMRLHAGEAFDRAAGLHAPEVGRILWVASHCRVTTSGDLRAVADDLTAMLCPNDASMLEHRDHVYGCGVSRSVTCSRPGMESDAVTLSSALPRQDAWWALYWSLDRTLLALQLDLGSQSDSDVHNLSERSHTIAAVYERISLYSSRVDSSLASAGARDLAVWECLADAWDLEFRMGCVERKLMQMQRVYANAVTSVQSTRTARVGLMIAVFTAFSVVASAVAVVQYAASDKNGTLAIRVAILLLAAAVSLGAVMAAMNASARSLRSSLEGRSATARRP